MFNNILNGLVDVCLFTVGLSVSGFLLLQELAVYEKMPEQLRIGADGIISICLSPFFNKDKIIFWYLSGFTAKHIHNFSNLNSQINLHM